MSLKVVLENLLRHLDGTTVTPEDITAFSTWIDQGGRATAEIAYRPARVLMQDFTGVPAVVDLAAMRDAMKVLGGDPERINPLIPVDLVIDHSVMVDEFGTPRAFRVNTDREYERNGERYRFLKWGQSAFRNFRVVPPGTGICHQVNLEYLARTVQEDLDQDGTRILYPDTLVGTDSHTTMVNGLAVLGWGVGGIEAEAAMLGQPISMLLPEVVGFRVEGTLREGVTATDLVLTVTQMLRARGVVGKFRRILRPRPGPAATRRPRDHRQHGPGIRGHLRIFPGGRGNAPLPAHHRTVGLDHHAGGGLCQGERPVADPGDGDRLHRHAVAGSRRCRTLAGRTEAAAGPGAARHGSPGVPEGPDRGIPRSRTGRKLPPGPTTARSPMAMWSSPRSPPAPTPRIRM